MLGNTPFGVLKSADERRLLAALRELYALSDMRTYPRRVTAALSSIIPTKFITYNELNSDKRKNRYVWWPPDTQLEKQSPLYRAFERYVGEHPLIAHYARTRDTRVLSISDFLTRRQFQRLDLYREFFRPLGVEYQLAVTLTASNSTVIGIALNRGTRDFSARERRLLVLLRPHLIQAFENAALASTLKGRKIAAADRGGVPPLSNRELEVLSWCARGKTNHDIGTVLAVSPRTIQKHLEHAFEKLGVENRTAAVMRAIELSLRLFGLVALCAS